ncbi:HlyU family transcriptional regulator [Aestuariivirga sp.]|uniref:HlyU family transcriptional regulator n=1 Tax=Aestuariivirga sp. TaxID=2650926 RepID=UPI00391A6F1E
MSFLKKLFGGGRSADSGPSKPKKQVEYNGYLISATPYKEGGQWQTCGTVSKTLDGIAKEHRFIRADRFADEEGAVDHSIMKGQQIVDQLGDRIFD